MCYLITKELIRSSHQWGIIASMNQAYIQLHLRSDLRTWTVIINGREHHSLTGIDAEELVEFAMLAAEQEAKKLLQ